VRPLTSKIRRSSPTRPPGYHEACDASH
jgi:hypothetical protein